jgi:hypothetical protein
MSLQRFAVPIVLCLLLGQVVVKPTAQEQAPSPGVVTGGFCTRWAR